MSMTSAVVDPRRKPGSQALATTTVSPSKRPRVAVSVTQASPGILAHRSVSVMGEDAAERRTRKGSLKKAIAGSMRGSAKKMTKTLRRIGSMSRKEMPAAEAALSFSDPWRSLELNGNEDAVS